MLDIRRISSSRWWHKKKSWILFVDFFIFSFCKDMQKDLYIKIFFTSFQSHFGLVQFQKEIILKSIRSRII